MPTPVGLARQCLAEAAAVVLDDAVAVAKRRAHGQTTSLHAVSALLALPSSALREACSRARSGAYPTRVQFRALELCVGVALDRISVSKSAVEEPPVSNSLMAAIKRSQANQRRHPETFHLYQQQLMTSSNSPSVKVELKHFVMSILDDPIVSRVFDDAGFQTHEIKLAILNPIAMSRFSSPTSRPSPPLFLCSLRDFELNKPYPNFPFPDGAAANAKPDLNSRRIGEILLTRNRRKNPLLIGACAIDAYRNFIDSLNSGASEVLPKEINGLKVASIEHELSEFINRAISEDSMGSKLQQIDSMAEHCQGPGIIASCGDISAFVDIKSADAVSFIVSELKKLLTKPGSKLWLIGFLASDSDYNKLVKQFPSMEEDLDLHLLPITSSTAAKCFRSSLMKSFVPFGGLFPMPSELETSSTAATQLPKLCKLCNEKCNQEVSTVLKGQSNLPSSLQNAPCKETKEDKALLDARGLALQRKWIDICQRLHFSQKSQPDSHTSTHPSFPASSPSDLTVTTDLRLGTFYDCRRKPDVQDFQNVESSRSCEKSPVQVSQSPSCSYNVENVKDLEHPWNVLAEKVYWQVDAIRAISRTLSRLRNGNSRNAWLGFSGPDKVGKRKIAASIAEIVFGTGNKYEHLQRFDLNSAQDMSCGIKINSIADPACGNVKTSGRKLIVDCLAEELRKCPDSVVLLENVEKADFLVRQSLLQAVKTGKFPDSYGRDVNINSNIFVLASTVRKGNGDTHEFPEEKILEAKSLQMRILVEGIDGRDNSRSKIPARKRKLVDLNLPVEDDAEDINDGSDDESGMMWLEELLECVDKNMVFKPCDFDSLNRRILKEIDVRVGDRIVLEIHEDVMGQILAAAWVADGENALWDWIEHVLCASVEGAREKYGDDSGMKLKLMPCDGVAVEARAPGICLPGIIYLD